ncbi:MAG: hypothetical protein KJ077_03370 [Anaerolineae bacterium]|nr:hypothetical protein [Anaerolineae bacterium]
MSVSAVSSTGSTTTPETKPAKSSSAGMEGLGQEAFMTLLLAQMKNQDPLKPMEDKDFIAQLAQFNSLSQLTEMNKTIKELMASQTLAQGSALIGKTVSGLSGDGGTVTGLVSAVRLAGGQVTLDVDGHEMALDRVKSVQG